MLHKAIQHKIASLIGYEKVAMEHPFPHHFADLYWPEKKLIIEIQCTPIALEEAIKRTLDYEKMGLNIVWILHQKSFNKKYLSPTELFLRSRSALFTDIFVNDTGIIYDQDEVIAGHRRLFRSSPYPIDITQPEILPWWVRHKRRLMIDALWNVGKGSVGFKGDRREKDLKASLKWFTIKNRLNPFYRKFEGHEWAGTRIICFLLRLFSHLVSKNAKNIGVGRRNRRGSPRRSPI